MEENDQLKEKMTVVESRLSFLLNKVQSDEEARVIQAEDRKKLEAQVQTLTAKCEEFHHKLSETGESNRVITQAMRLKQEELNEITMKYELLYKEAESREANEDRGEREQDMTGAKAGAPDDIDNVRLNEGRGRFYVEVKTIGGGSMLLLRGRKPLYREWMEKQSVNEFLKRCQKTTRFRDMIIEKLASLYGLLMVEEEEKNKIIEEVQSRDKLIDHLQKKLIYVQDCLATEEDAKRRMLLRYIHAIKEQAASAGDGLGGVLQLPESNVSDEEVHALAALLRNSMSIDELNLRGNNITDDGARALAAVLSGRSGLRTVDLRGNRIGKSAIRILAEALERAERVRHVYVHAGGKIEALGTGKWNKTKSMGDSTTMGSQDLSDTAKQSMNVETVCVVDIRDNYPEKAKPPFDLDEKEATTSTLEQNGSSTFTPSQMLESTGAPVRAESAKGSKRSDNLAKNMDNALAKSKSTNAFSLPSKVDKKKEKQMLKAKKENDLREAAWQGRSGGFDVSRSLSKDSLYLQTKKAQRGDLPPIEDGKDGKMFDDDEERQDVVPLRASSAPDPFENFGKKNNANPDSPENVAKNALLKARGKAGRKKKISKAEARLLESPFARTSAT